MRFECLGFVVGRKKKEVAVFEVLMFQFHLLRGGEKFVLRY
jgi:hypothetical protein